MSEQERPLGLGVQLTRLLCVSLRAHKTSRGELLLTGKLDSALLRWLCLRAAGGEKDGKPQVCMTQRLPVAGEDEGESVRTQRGWDDGHGESLQDTS